MKTTQFHRHVYAVQRYSEFTAARYDALMAPGIRTHPICCFGRVESAEVVTVGVNPSCGEFAPSRWPDTIEHTALADRCANYFDKPNPHPWFNPWHKALSSLRCSYGNGSSVHLDLSPRATRVVSDFKEAHEQDLFLEMVERDLWTFFATLELCDKAKLLLIAGTVTGEFYINEFLQKFAPRFGYSLDGAFRRADYPGKGKTCWHRLANKGKTIPVFFCSSSPADRKNPEILPERIAKEAERIREVLDEPRV
jgi:hypothetical protein